MKAIVIDDEKRARITLSLLLEEYNPDVLLVAECENLPEGVKAIRKHQPDLVFLDIEMPGHSGLELLDFFDESEIHFSIIFTTAYNEYAIQAFKFSAIDYLLKPINPEELTNAIARLEKQKQRLENIKALQENIKQESLKRIAVPTNNGLLFLDIDKIMYIKGEGAYSEIIYENDSKILVSRNLKNFEDIVCADTHFLRVHKSFIVNLSFVAAYIKSDGGSLILQNKQEIPVSPDKVQVILENIQIVKR
jgi:two-component system LytT family response regulator